jgi:hypothetical protein
VPPLLALPDGWVDRTVLTYVGPDAGRGSPSLVVTAEELRGDMELERYAAMHDAGVRAGLEGVELLDESRTAVGGRPAICHTYAWSYGERHMRQRMWCLIDGEIGYAIVASAATEEFDGLGPVWERAVASFAPEP